MKKIFLMLLLSLLLIPDAGAAEAKQPEAAKRKKMTNIHLVYTGMPKDEVMAVMGEEMKTGYQTKDDKPGYFEPIYVKQPVRTEKVSVNKDKYEVYYFFSHVLKPDGIISDDELTPVVFLKNKVVAKGWDDLFDLKKNQKK